MAYAYGGAPGYDNEGNPLMKTATMRDNAHLALAGAAALGSIGSAIGSNRAAATREKQFKMQEKTAFWHGFEKEAALFSIKHELAGDSTHELAKTIKRVSNFRKRDLVMPAAIAGGAFGAGQHLAHAAFDGKKSQ